ncbi:FAD/NAD(P)-binding domain-containing protein [Exidia glandulosa HHB12029]|uniref:FAD/NAD(P)-binding domain-containing protein n=1 Tax=Exidia glandulosa HHB12029 TaxID=1314781 RepID=A0A166NIA5_EXIGL|nr:FAD/NAD(P)-binding domain-containing protein [Exidia glandulosa HHB12029]
MSRIENVKRVAIVGGGASGLVALKALLEQGVFDEVVLFERREDVGGVWFFDPKVASEEARRYAQDASTRYPVVLDDGSAPKYPSPAYEGMIGNIAHELISISGRPFDKPLSTGPVQEGEREESDLFPSLDSTIAYLRAFADAYSLHNHIKLDTEVVSTRFVDGKWKVMTKNLLNGEETSSTYDAVVYAAGLWDRRHLPAIAGIDSLPKERLLHARFYRSPTIFAGKRILILGNGNSANDIASHAAPVALEPVYRSIRHPSYYSYVPDAKIHDVKPVRQFSLDPASGKVIAELGDDTVIRDIDLVVAATGYRYDVPSLRVPSRDGSAQDEPITPPDGHRMLGLYRHIFHARFPTLAFIGYSIAWSPFANSEAQASVVARAWAGRIDVPSVEEMIKDEEDSVKEVGDHNLFHVLALYKKREYGYGNELREWALQGGVEGTVGVHWDERRIWLLQNVVRLKTLQLQRERGLIT